MIEPTSILLHSEGMFQPTYLNSSESIVKSSGFGITGSYGSDGSSTGFVVSVVVSPVSPFSSVLLFSSVIEFGSVCSSPFSVTSVVEVVSTLSSPFYWAKESGDS